jgi:hypothetical protein
MHTISMLHYCTETKNSIAQLRKRRYCREIQKLNSAAEINICKYYVKCLPIMWILCALVLLWRNLYQHYSTAIQHRYSYNYNSTPSCPNSELHVTNFILPITSNFVQVFVSQLNSCQMELQSGSCRLDQVTDQELKSITSFKSYIASDMFLLQSKWAGKPRRKWLEVQWCRWTLQSASDLVQRIPTQQGTTGERCKIQEGVGKFSEVTLAWKLVVQCLTTVCFTLRYWQVNTFNWKLHLCIQTVGVILFVLATL